MLRSLICLCQLLGWVGGARDNSAAVSTALFQLEAIQLKFLEQLKNLPRSHLENVNSSSRRSYASLAVMFSPCTPRRTITLFTHRNALVRQQLRYLGDVFPLCRFPAMFSSVLLESRRTTTRSFVNILDGIIGFYREKCGGRGFTFIFKINLKFSVVSLFFNNGE